MLSPTCSIGCFITWKIHYVYITRNNSALSQFRVGWNNHHIRTEHNLSPKQLFTVGIFCLQRSALDFRGRVGKNYGTDEDALPPSSADYSGVEVPVSLLTVSSTPICDNWWISWRKVTTTVLMCMWKHCFSLKMSISVSCVHVCLFVKTSVTTWEYMYNIKNLW